MRCIRSRSARMDIDMEQNPFTFLNQAIGQLLATNSPAIQTMGLDIFRGLAVIMIAWFGIQNALSTAQGFYGSSHFGQFANLLLVISFGLGMLTYYSSPIPGMGYSFCDLITQEALQLSGQIESKQTQVIADAVTHAEEQLLSELLNELLGKFQVCVISGGKFEQFQKQ